MELNNLENILFSKTPSISSLDSQHRAKRYCHKRLVPSEYLIDLFWVEDLNDWLTDKKNYISIYSKDLIYNPSFKPGNLVEEFSDFKITHNDKISLILFPCRNRNNKLMYVHARRLDEYKSRFLLISEKNNNNYYYYGLERLNLEKRIYVCEGQFDSLVIKNSLSLCGVLRIQYLLKEEWFKSLSKDNIIFVLDHDIKNWITYSWSLYLSEQGYRVFILPFWIKKTDINDIAQLVKNRWLLEKIIIFFSSTPPKLNYFILKLRWKIIDKLEKIKSKLNKVAFY